jgi:hypothetical protein
MVEIRPPNRIDGRHSTVGLSRGAKGAARFHNYSAERRFDRGGLRASVLKNTAIKEYGGSRDVHLVCRLENWISFRLPLGSRSECE